jgi:hypothetical protein
MLVPCECSCRKDHVTLALVILLERVLTLDRLVFIASRLKLSTCLLLGSLLKTPFINSLTGF